MNIRFVVLLTACSYEPPTPTTFAGINDQILSGCAGASVCHAAKVCSQGNLDLRLDPYAALVGVPAVNTKAAASGLLRVRAGDPAQSFLVRKLTLPPDPTSQACDPDSTAHSTCEPNPIVGSYGSCMPQSNLPLDPRTVAAIERWIASGAPNN